MTGRFGARGNAELVYTVIRTLIGAGVDPAATNSVSLCLSLSESIVYFASLCLSLSESIVYFASLCLSLSESIIVQLYSCPVQLYSCPVPSTA